MTTSTLHDLTRIAALPGTPGACSASRFETRESAPPANATTLCEAMQAFDQHMALATALRAIDNAENRLPERPAFLVRFGADGLPEEVVQSNFTRRLFDKMPLVAPLMAPLLKGDERVACADDFYEVVLHTEPVTPRIPNRCVIRTPANTPARKPE